MEYKKHFKLYKAGKNWCCAAILSASILLGTSVLTNNAYADSTSSSNAPATTNVAVQNGTTNTANTGTVATTTAQAGSTANSSATVQNGEKQPAAAANTATAANSQQAGSTAPAGVTATTQVQTAANTADATTNKTATTVSAVPATSTPNTFSTVNGKVYYYGNDGNEYKDQFYTNWGHTYYFGKDGARYTNQFYNNWGHTYYFGADGARWDNSFMVRWGNAYYFGNDGALLTNQSRNIQGTTYNFNKDGVITNNQNRFFTDHDGKVYYFDDKGQEYVNQFYTNWGHTYYFGGDGARYTNQFYSNWGNMYYFGADGARYTNQFYSNWGHMYYFGNDGARYTNQFYRNWGHTYYFGADGARWDNSFMVRWGNAYYFGNDGALLTDQSRTINGTRYNFNREGIITNLRNQFITDHDGKVYYFDNNGQEYVNQFYSNWGHMYYFGSDGARYTNQFYKNWGHVYFFGAGGARYDNQWYRDPATNDTYYFGNDGAALTGWQDKDGNRYYFDPTTAKMLTGLQKINNKTYYFDTQDGKTYGTMKTGWATVNGVRYYFGSDGAGVTGKQTIDGHEYLFDTTGGVVNGVSGKVENGQLVVYNKANNQVVKTVSAGTWENMPYSLDTSSINNVDGYISYSGWFRPYGTSQDGKTWYKTTVMDWRPILMYTWPSKDAEAQFIKYFVNHGYANADYGLTKDSVANLSKDTDSTTLDNDAQNLRYVIEQQIAAKKGTSQLATDITNFLNQLSVNGAYNSGQIAFVNNNSKDQKVGNTSYDDSNYRLLNRTINNQHNTDSSDGGYELLLGTDIDNSNPVVQAENFNWEYFLLNYGKLMNASSKDYNADGNFDGLRIDAADNMDADVLDQVAQLVNDMYHTKGNQANANDHLLYNEGYHSGAARMLNSKNNPELFMDASIYYTMENVLGHQNNRQNVNGLINGSVVNRANDVTDGQATPNWSFVTNHDQRETTINQIIQDQNSKVNDVIGTNYNTSYESKAWQEFYADEAKTNKKYAPYNIPAQYAILLSNKDTVPQIYYGDLYNESDQYMKTKSMYYDAITTLMKARQEFVSGGQKMTALNNNLLTSVRYGKGVKNGNATTSDSISRTTGMAVVIGNNPTMGEQTIEINMGKEHANQNYKNLMDTTATGLTYDGNGSLNGASLKTDANGILRVKVKGFANPYVSGYLSVWVPVVSQTQSALTSSSEVANNKDKYFVSNAALDSHVIYGDFSLYQPQPTSVSEHAYNVIANNANLFKDWGITDFWMAPAYRAFSMSRYQEGYAMTDRYDLGTTAKPTKYGSGEEMTDAIAALHKAGLKVEEDIVMNQMMGLPTQEAITVNTTDTFGKPVTVNGKQFTNQVYFAYTKGGGDGQKEYGGKYLAELKAKYPDLFTTKAASTGVAPDPNTKITEWIAKYENGTSYQNFATGLAVKLANGEYAYINDGKNNKTFPTTLPENLSSADYYAEKSIK